MPGISPSALESLALNILQAAGTTAEEAEVVSRSLVGANRRGYDSHGVMRLANYVQMLQSGQVKSGVDLEIKSESPSRLVASARWGLGQVQAHRLLNRLMEKANTGGVGVGTLLHAGHIGRLGEYCEAAAAAGFVCMVMVNSHGAVVRMAPPGGIEPRLSTNPIAIGAPCENESLVLDFSTSATAEGKVRVKHIAGQQCPPGLLIDCRGQPTTDPAALYADPPGSILPFGGAQAYKAFGLGLMIEILTGALSGGDCARPTPTDVKGNCVFMLVLSPEHFGGKEHFAAEVKQLAEYVRSCPTAAGVDSILLPGDPERSRFAATAEGIELDTAAWKQLTELATSLGVEAGEA